MINIYEPNIQDYQTSAIDAIHSGWISNHGKYIQLATDKLTQNRTSIIIAHRLSTIQKADSIVVLEKGEIVEQGSHQYLIKKGGQYKNLFDKQFLEEE